MLLGSIVAALVAAGFAIGLGVPTMGSSSAPTHARATAATHAVKPHLSRLHPPGPIPGYLLIADRGNNRMLLVDSSHRIYWRYPSGGAKAMPFVFDDDTFFGPHHDRIVSNQEDQDTIQVISFPGRRVLWRYGHVDVKSGRAGYLNTPDDAYLLPSGVISVADAYNCRVLFISRAHRIVRQYGTTGVCRHDPPQYLGAVNGATPLADGGTLVSEIPGSWIDDFGPSGELRWTVQAPVSYPSDPQLLSPNTILLADYAKPGHAIIMTRSGRVLWRYGPSSGLGELDHPSLATRIAPDLIAINDDFRDRVVIVSIRAHRIVWQYGHTDQPGTAPGYLRTPDGLDLLGTQTAQASPAIRQLMLANRTRTAAAAGPHAGGLSIRTVYRLPSPVEREVAVEYGGAVIVAGGLDAVGGSTDGVFRLNPSSGALTPLGTVPQAFHDAAGAILGHDLYVFGGGAAQSSSSVQRFDLTARAGSIVGSLPTALSDIAAATTPAGVYLVGGYDGHVPRREIYRTTDGRHFSLVARLPVGLRYPAVAAVGGTIVIAGGTSPTGASNGIYALETRSNTLRLLGHLRDATAHAQAFALGGKVYVAGGVDTAGHISETITRIDPATERFVDVPGLLPVSDAATVASPSSALVIGGATSTGPSSTVRRVAPG